MQLQTYHIVDKVGAESGAALKLGVGGADASVDNIGGDALAGGIVKNIGLGTDLAVRDAVQARRSIGLCNHGLCGNPGVGLDVVNLVGVEHVHEHVVVGVEDGCAPGIHLEGRDFGRKKLAAKATLAQVALLDGGGEDGLLGVNSILGKGVVVDDDVAVGNDVGFLSLCVGNGQPEANSLPGVVEIARSSGGEAEEQEDGSEEEVKLSHGEDI